MSFCSPYFWRKWFESSCSRILTRSYCTTNYPDGKWIQWMVWLVGFRLLLLTFLWFLSRNGVFHRSTTGSTTHPSFPMRWSQSCRFRGCPKGFVVVGRGRWTQRPEVQKQSLQREDCCWDQKDEIHKELKGFTRTLSSDSPEKFKKDEFQ